MAQSNTNSISGESISIAFVAVGLVFGFWLKNAFGTITNYISAIFLLVGIVAAFVELQKHFSSTQPSLLHLDNLGVGILLLVPGAYFAWLAMGIEHWLLRGVLEFLLTFVLILGFAGTFDGLVSIFKGLIRTSQNFWLGLFKIVGLTASTATTIAALLKQLNILQ